MLAGSARAPHCPRELETGRYAERTHMEASSTRVSEAERFWSIEEASAKTNISEENLRRMCRDGRIKHCTKIGQQWAINPYLEWPDMFGTGEA